ncbi:dual oxidase, partial [Elysia marginata]
SPAADIPVQRYDGWYNNPMNPTWGAVDETYRPSGYDRPNARVISNALFSDPLDSQAHGNIHNRTSLFAFFGNITYIVLFKKKSFKLFVNRASSYIDGSFLYGTSIVRMEFLREPQSGKLGCEDRFGNFPFKNDVNLPYHPFTYHHYKAEELWRMGDTHTFENRVVLSLSVLFYRYHNMLTLEAMKWRRNLSSDVVFEKAKRWVIGTMQ